MLASPAYPTMHDYQFPRRTPVSSAPPPVYDERGRQQHFIESSVQRKERVEFLKQREWARRVAEWVRDTNASQDVTTFGRFRPFPPHPAPDAGYIHYPFSSPSAIPFPREEEPYIIYSSSPSSSFSSLSEDTTPMTHAISPPSPTASYISGVPQPTQKRAFGHQRRRSSASIRTHTRRPSLSSIFEVPEED